ncbi:MAG: organic hydroperoxide resistance protein [Gemmatales bacterium]
MPEIKPFYTAHATAVGGRNGNTKSDDGLVDVNLSVPKAMGGPGKPDTTTPEHLFAAGYAACFGGACEFMAKQMKMPMTTLAVHSEVTIGSIPSGFGLAVVLNVDVGGLSQEDAEKVVAAGHKLCPYSNAIKGNVDVKLNVKVV